MKYFINYASNGFLNSQREGIRTAQNFGFEAVPYNESNIDNDFVNSNRNILSHRRGAGYWIWKPYIILDMLTKIDDQDFLIYMDSGANLIGDPQEYLDMIDDNGVLAFSMIQKTSKWTKGDCFYFVNSNFQDRYMFRDENQLQATYIFLKKNQKSINFVTKWLNFCKNENIMTDKPNQFLANLPDFIDHRHDQSIFSLLCYQDKILQVPQIDQHCVEHGLSIDRKIVNRHGIRY